MATDDEPRARPGASPPAASVVTPLSAAFAYEHADIAPGVTLREWRSERAGAPRRGRRGPRLRRR